MGFGQTSLSGVCRGFMPPQLKKNKKTELQQIGPKGSQVCPNLGKVQNCPQPVKWANLFRANPVILLLQVSSLTFNSLYYILSDLWKSCQISPSEREKRNFGMVMRIFVCFIFGRHYIGWSKTCFVFDQEISPFQHVVFYWILVFDPCQKGFGRIQKRLDQTKDCKIILY